jgi:hypothetical protein
MSFSFLLLPPEERKNYTKTPHTPATEAAQDVLKRYGIVVKKMLYYPAVS